MMIIDGLKSLIGRLGDPARDKSAGVAFAPTILADTELVAAYEGNWIARKIVDIPAKDALRKWRGWDGEHHKAIEAEEKRLQMRSKVTEALVKARLFGGAAIYIGTDQRPDTPLDVNAIGPGGLRYLTVLMRRELTPNALERDPLSESYGRPASYRIASASSGGVTVHPSRLVILRGDAQADPWFASGLNHGWDESVLKATADIVKQAGGTFANVSSLIFEANVDVIKIPDLQTKVGTEQGENLLLKRFALAARNKGINGTLILDSDEEYERRSAAFAQLPEIMEAFAVFCAAAADIPATRFLARSPTGLVATGGHDMDNYHDKLQGMQELQIGPALARADACLTRSAGVPENEPATYQWRPLQQMNEKALAEIGELTAKTLVMMLDLGLTEDEIRELTIHRMSENGAFPHLSTIVEETKRRLEIGGEMPDAA